MDGRYQVHYLPRFAVDNIQHLLSQGKIVNNETRFVNICNVCMVLMRFMDSLLIKVFEFSDTIRIFLYNRGVLCSAAMDRRIWSWPWTCSTWICIFHIGRNISCSWHNYSSGVPPMWSRGKGKCYYVLVVLDRHNSISYWSIGQFRNNHFDCMDWLGSSLSKNGSQYSIWFVDYY